MTPLRLLSLWRERWGKELPENRLYPYQKGGIGTWVERTSESIAGSIPVLGLFAVMAFAALSLILLDVKFSLANQHVLSAFLLIATLLIRRYQGMVPTLVLMGFAIVATTRYLYWRFDSSLRPTYELDYFVALALWCLELYGVALFGLMVLSRLWPIKQITQALPEDSAKWPKVAVFICAKDRSEDDIFHSVSALKLTQWPPSKLSLTVVDHAERPALLSALAAMHVRYLHSPNPADGGYIENLNRAMTDADSELAVILSAGQTPAPDFLMTSSGWFMADGNLGLVTTPHHFLLPEPAAHMLDQLAGQAPAAEVMITRVAHFLKVGGIPLEAMSAQSHLVHKLNKFGLGHAYWLHEADLAYRIHDPLFTQALSLRIWVAHALDALGFFQPVLRYTLLTVPLLYLLADQQPMATSPTLWSAYALPHLIQGYALYSRTHSNFRWPVWMELREGIFATYLLILTFFTTGWTLLRTKKLPHAETPSASELKGFRLSLFDRLMLGLHSMALAAGLRLLLQADQALSPTISFYMAWSSIVLLLLVAKFAVYKEAAEVSRQKRRLSVMRGMIRLPNNRTVTCQTQNFPQLELVLDLSATPNVKSGQRLKLSIFHALDELAVDVTVVQSAASSVTVKIDPTWQGPYSRFSQAVFARGPDWPNWLPHQHVDRIIPQWLILVCAWPLDWVAKWLHRLSKKPSAQAVNSSAPTK